MKKVNFFTFILLITVFTCIFASANAQTTEITFNLKDFNKLQIGSAFVIDVTKSAQFSINAKGSKENLDDVEANVKNGELQIKYKTNTWNKRKNGSVYLYITMPELQGVSFSGATKSSIQGFSVNGTFRLSLSGASESNVNLKAENMDISLSGASSAKVFGGNTSKMAVDISGASELNAYECEAEKTVIKTSGASSAKIAVSSALNANASGSSTIRYRGNPNVNSDSSGSSRISKE